MDLKEEMLRVPAELTVQSVGPGQCGVQTPSRTLVGMLPQAYTQHCQASASTGKCQTPKGLKQHLGDQFSGT